MEYKRLTERTENNGVRFNISDTYYRTVYPQNESRLHTEVDKLAIRLAELEDKIEQGTLIELPCKVGDTVYAVKKKTLKSHWDEHRYIIDEWDEWAVCELPFSLTLWECGGIIGKDYYLTREEAEKRLTESK